MVGFEMTEGHLQAVLLDSKSRTAAAASAHLAAQSRIGCSSHDDMVQGKRFAWNCGTLSPFSRAVMCLH